MPKFDVETVDTMCAIAGLEVPEEEKKILAGMLERHVAAFTMVVGTLDLQEVAPADRFEPDWNE
jgi:hypothetical protein